MNILKNLTPSELDSIAAWDSKQTYKALQKIVMALKNHNASMTYSESISAQSEWDIAKKTILRSGEVRGLKGLLDLPEKARKLIDKRANERDKGDK